MNDLCTKKMELTFLQLTFLMLFFLFKPHLYFRALFKRLFCNQHVGSAARHDESQTHEAGGGGVQ